jgi:hypothetical protein
MSEDAPVNTGAGEWPDPDPAYLTVRRMQIKLHRWAGEDSSRRFGDLFVHNEVVFTGASSVAVTRYRYRGNTIPTPWTPNPAAAAYSSG